MRKENSCKIDRQFLLRADYGPIVFFNFAVTDDTPDNLRLNPKRHMGRGRLISVDGWMQHDPSAEWESESTINSDQPLTEIALKSANSSCATPIQRDQERASDTVEHVETLVAPTHGKVLRRVLQAIEAGESYKEAGLHPEQVSRFFSAAREAFTNAVRRKRLSEPHVIAEYNPRCVPQEL